MTQGADYSGGRPSGAALKQAGFDFVIRYVGLGSAGKRLTAAEYRDLTAAGVRVLLVAELGTGDSWGSSTDDDYGRGRANAAAALADAQGCGVPESEIFVFAASDAHASAQWQIADTVAYVTGFRDVLGVARTGHYGFSETNVAVHNAGVASGFWRCGSEPSTADKAWVNFWQRNAAPTTRVVSGVICDINEQYQPLQEDDMQLEDKVQLWDGRSFSVANCLAGVIGHAEFIENQNKQLAASVDGLAAALAAAAKDPGITLDAVKQVVTDAVQQSISITGDVHIGPATPQ